MFITIYGINNLGKSTQAKKLVERFTLEGHRAEYLKYPIYDIEPFGSMLNAYLRQGNPYTLSPREAQTLYVLDRFHYQPTLTQKLADGIHVVAEDYTHTGIAWGMGSGVEEEYLHRINAPLLQPDIAFYFYGERFTESTEQNHKHETNTELLARVQEAHDTLAERHGWIRVHANRPVEEIHDHLWSEVHARLS